MKAKKKQSAQMELYFRQTDQLMEIAEAQEKLEREKVKSLKEEADSDESESAEASDSD